MAMRTFLKINFISPIFAFLFAFYFTLYILTIYYSEHWTSINFHSSFTHGMRSAQRKFKQHAIKRKKKKSISKENCPGRWNETVYVYQEGDKARVWSRRLITKDMLKDLSHFPCLRKYRKQTSSFVDLNTV